MAFSILPVIVIYKCELSNAASYKSLLKDAYWKEIAVYDNSPQGADTSSWDKRIIYLSDPSNGGLSKAYNWAAKLAHEKGYSHLLLLDQDTVFPPEAVQAYKNNLTKGLMFAPLVETTKGSNLSPVYIGGWYPKATAMMPQVYPLNKFQPINSGMCVPIDLYQKCGGYNDKVWLDFSDYEFGRRLRKVAEFFMLIDLKVKQNYSGEVVNVAQKLRRYKCYIDCAHHCTFDTWYERLRHHYVVLIDTLWHVKHCKSLEFLKIYILKFLFRSTHK